MGELALAWAGLRHRPGSWLLLALGAALAAVMPLAAVGLQERAAVGAVEQAVAAVPDASRGVLAVTSRDLRGPELTGVSGRVQAGFADAGLLAPTRALAFRALSLQGTDTTVAALDPLADEVALASGRLPASCAPTACEVLAVSSGGVADADLAALTGPARGLGLVVTGTATLREPLLVGLGLVAPGQPLLLGADPGAMADLEGLTLYGRNLAWFAPLDPAVVATRGADRLAGSLDRLSAEVGLVSGPLNLVWPDAAVLDAAARGQDSAGRFAVLGVGAGALQLGFCLVLAAGRRPSARQHGTLLGRRGARPAQVLAVAALQAGIAVLAGVVVGVLGGLGVVLALGGASSVAGASAALGRAWPVVLGLGVAAVLGSLAVAVGPTVRPRTVRLGLVAMVVVAGGLALLALVRPTSDPRAPLPVAALVALTLAVGLVAALLWTPVVALLGRTGGAVRHPGRRPLHRITLLAARRPLLPSLTAGFLAATLATALLAGSWSESTRRSAEDRAAAAVPLDVRVSPGTQVPLPATVVDAQRLTSVSPEVVVSGVTSTTVGAFAGSSGAVSLPLAGVDPAVLPLVHRWPTVTGSDVGAAELAARLRTSAPPPDGPTVPAGTRRLVLDVRGLDPDVTLGVWLAGPDGQERQARLLQQGPDEAYADLPGGPAQTVRALEIGESADHITHRQHGIGEGSTDRQLPAGTLRFGGVRADRHALPWSWAGWGADSVDVRADGQGALSARYQIRDARAVLQPGWLPRERRPVLPVAVDPVTAARAGSRGTLGVTVNQTTVPVRVVAVLPRMPTLGERFVLADRAAVSALVDAQAPGTAPVLQVWVSAPGESRAGVRDALAATASGATVSDRVDLARTFAADPVTRGFVALLGTAGAVAFLLALVAVVGGLRGERETAAADLFALEVDGVVPASLRRVLLARAGLVLAVGLPVGVLGGVGLALATARLLATGPDGRPLSPPLHIVLLSGPTGLVLLLAVAGPVLAALVTAGLTLREPRLAPPELDLR
ncbi:hypothetical protein [Microlunatus flavus]|uniref:FtsX-like permease family protein n=1 Tax=Microlunatus flavus TaxID=1036181 RepID=A0A1H9HE52_9ACTN|nr:hypothetical protein [Microlunatus flavus]SEQ60615.1 hypothetical protein SAMN05421756_104217 [Microlunatus flavus]